MCGIAGIFISDNNNNGIRPEIIINMSDSLHHRGPDDHGYFISDAAGNFRCGHLSVNEISGFQNSWQILFGHRRLSIIDCTDKGRQPMSDTDNCLWITYNGEIFNYLELKEELTEKGYKFNTNTDTEVVINSYKEWGKECVNRFNGMWAFAIWDSGEKKLFCSRDRFGIKPFYYNYKNGTLIFGSEIKSILESRIVKPEPDNDTIHDYLVEGKLCHNENTFFKDIKRLLPGTNLTITQDGDLQFEKYWFYSENKNHGNSSQESEFYQLMKDSVRLRLRSDVKNGMTLSGGLDSSYIALICNELDQHINAYSAVFPGYKHNEGEYINIVAEAFRINSTLIYPESGNFIDTLKKMIWHMDYPSLSRPAFSYYEIMKEIGKGECKVILEGQGADELLAGYVHKYTHLYISDIIRDKDLSVAGKFIKVSKTVFKLLKTDGIKPFAVSLGKIFPSLHSYYKKIIGIDNILINNSRNQGKGNPRYTDRRIYKSELVEKLYRDHSRDNLPYLLKYCDALSMASSIESRLPFMDYRIVNFIFSLDYSDIMNEGISKDILRKSVEGKLPDRIMQRKKVGFSTPVGEWFRSNTESIVNSVLLSETALNRGFYNFKNVRRLIKIQRSGIVDVSNYLYRLISVELWFQLFIDTNEDLVI